jgi:hypothetical protein
LKRAFVQEYPGILVSPAPASEVEEPRIKGVEELGVTGFLYPEVWKPIPASHAPPQNIPAAEKFSPDPDWTTFFIGFGVGLFIGLPIGRAILGAGARAAEAGIRRRIERY